MNFTMTTDTITVVDGGRAHSVRRGAPNFAALRAAILDEDWPRARGCLTVHQAVGTWSRGRFAVVGNQLHFDGRPVPESFGRRVMAALAAGGPDSVAPFLRFYERLSGNPSWRSTQQLFEFLQHVGIPLLPSGKFLAYKGVRHDYRDVHSNSFDNRPGSAHRMPRNLISDDPDVACHVGFHVGAVDYARAFPGAGRIVVCLVDPADVVCVPRDHSYKKMRVCAYAVVGNYGDVLPSGVLADEPTVPDAPDGEPVYGPPPTLRELLDLPAAELRRCGARLHVVGAAGMDPLDLAKAIRRVLGRAK